jgi:hypothetical protein
MAGKAHNENRLSIGSLRLRLCQNLASWDPTMCADIPMIDLYDEYAASARHLDHVAEKFNLPDDIIEPVDFDMWYEIFCRVFDREGICPELLEVPTKH